MRRATAYTLVAAFLWGTTFPAIRIGLEWGGAGPFTFVYLRFLIASLALAILAYSLRRIRADLFGTPAIWGLAVLNAVGYATQFVAQERTTASKTSLLVDIDVVIIAILGYYFLRERHGKEIVAALALGMLGVVLLSTGGDPSNLSLNDREFVGDALAFGAGIVWAVYFVGIKAFLERHPRTDGVALTFAILALTTLALFPAALLTEGLHATGNGTAWAMVIYLGLFPTAVAFFLWQEALRTEGVTVTSILLLLEIVVAVSVGVLLLHERIAGWALVGALLIVAATWLASKAPRPMHHDAAPEPVRPAG